MCRSLSELDVSDELVDGRPELERELGVRPSWPVESFSDARADVAQSMMRLEASPFVQHCDHIRGFVYDVETGLLDEVART